MHIRNNDADHDLTTVGDALRANQQASIKLRKDFIKLMQLRSMSLRQAMLRACWRCLMSSSVSLSLALLLTPFSTLTMQQSMRLLQSSSMQRQKQKCQRCNR
jgi:hypothetical protein